VLLEEIGKPERTVKKRDDLSPRSPPIVAPGNRRPIRSHYLQSKRDWKKPDKYRNYKAWEPAAENTATNELPMSNRPATEASGKVISDLPHAEKFCGE